MRLGFHYHVPAVEQAGAIYTPGYQGRFLDSLAQHCEQVVCFLHTPSAGERHLLDYRIASPNLALVDIGPHDSAPSRLAHPGRIIRPIDAWRSSLDAFLIRGPSPLLSHASSAAYDLPIALLLVGKGT